jgi:hypothetical protein
MGAMPMAPAAASDAPDWVATGGRSERHPAETWVTGYGQARGRDAETRARQAAMAALAQAIEVRVEFELEDDRSSGEDRYDERIAALTRTSSEMKLRDVRFETWRGDRRVHVLAAVERASASRWRREQRDRALVRAEACLADAELAREVGELDRAERRLADCRTAHSVALRHDTVSVALAGADEHEDGESPARIERLGTELDRAESAAQAAPPRSLAEVADRIAEQLVGQGLRRPRRLDVTPLVDAGTDLPSPFGQAAALEIERALAQAWNGEGQGRRDPRRIELGGAHRESADGVRLTVVAREFGSGTLAASGAAALPRDALPEGLALRPANWAPALERRESLEAALDGAPGPSRTSSSSSFSSSSAAAPPPPRPPPASSPTAAAPLRVELWTDRGRERVSYTEGESIHVFMRVSGPAWVRLVYVLPNGLAVPIEDAFHVDAERARAAIALPERLEVVPPFGVEMLHAAAFPERPPPLPTRRVQVAGQTYDVLDEGVDALVRSRGVRVRLGAAVAEDVLTVTTLAGSTGSEWRVRDGD